MKDISITESNSSEFNKNEDYCLWLHLSSLSAFLGVPLGHLILPGILWFAKRDDRYVHEHGRRVINFHLSMLLYTICTGALAFGFLIVSLPIIGGSDALTQESSSSLPLFWMLCAIASLLPITLVSLFALVGGFVFPILAAVKVKSGTYFNYPFSLNLIKPLEGQSFECSDVITESFHTE